MFKEIPISKSITTLATLSTGQLYTNNIQTFLYIGISTSRMFAIFSTLDTGVQSQFRVTGLDNTSNLDFILSFARVLLC